MERKLFSSAALTIGLLGFIAPAIQAQECSQREIDEWWRTRGNPVPANVVLPREYACATTSITDKTRFDDFDLDNGPSEDARPNDVSFAVSDTTAYWTPGQVIQVCFLPDRQHEYLRGTVQAYAQEWEKYANLKLNFKMVGDCETYGSDIRISLQQSGRSWSYIGTESKRYARAGKATLELGWLADTSTPPASQRSTVIHEFGHALGLHHEQQNPTVKINFDLYRTYSYFARTNGWCPETTYHNVLRQLNDNVDYTLWDRYSIMHYEISGAITTDGFSVKRSKDLSEGDKLWATLVYPPADRNRKDLWAAYRNYVAIHQKLPSREEILQKQNVVVSDFRIILEGNRHTRPAIDADVQKLGLVEWVRYDVTTRWGESDSWTETVSRPVDAVEFNFATENLTPIIDIVKVKAVVHVKGGQELVISQDFKSRSSGNNIPGQCSNHPAASNYCGAN